MKRVLLILAALGNLGVAASQVQAHEYHYWHGGYYAGYAYPRVLVRPWVAPGTVCPPVVYPPVVYPSVAVPGVAAYPTYVGPAAGFYYNGPRVSVGVGF
jgi:hypothetical protein